MFARDAKLAADESDRFLDFSMTNLLNELHPEKRMKHNLPSPASGHRGVLLG
ncbi:hypothetical protein [uncultured Bradyrhizobium sp.]|uniref:hypothetical protein n=1 Tax=uncultured Bradyrhizobium sp. TaxID=199684 RepID=UPI002604032A|nr:hypothetical protein [uncultured Bradyrhizobium sp.]